MTCRLRASTQALVVLLVAACTALEPNPTTTIEGSPTTVIEQPTTTTTLSPPPTDPTTTISTVPRVEVEYRDGQFIGPNRFRVDRDEVFDVWLVSDVTHEVHVHGYDLFFDLEPGEPVNLRFVASVPGIFEVELESDHVLLFEIEVAG